MSNFRKKSPATSASASALLKKSSSPAQDQKTAYDEYISKYIPLYQLNRQRDIAHFAHEVNIVDVREAEVEYNKRDAYLNRDYADEDDPVCADCNHVYDDYFSEHPTVIPQDITKYVEFDPRTTAEEYMIQTELLDTNLSSERQSALQQRITDLRTANSRFRTGGSRRRGSKRRGSKRRGSRRRGSRRRGSKRRGSKRRGSRRR
jgi:hypothetical protein